MEEAWSEPTADGIYRHLHAQYPAATPDELDAGVYWLAHTSAHGMALYAARCVGSDEVEVRLPAAMCEDCIPPAFLLMKHQAAS